MTTTTTTLTMSSNPLDDDIHPSIMLINNQPTPSITLARSIPSNITSNDISNMLPFDLFKTQLSETSSGSTEAKVDAMKRLSVVAFAMGIDDTLSMLLPYLATIAMKNNPSNEDELLIHMAKELRKIVPTLLKGTQALPLLPILERLASVEETVVRDQAVISINHIIPQLFIKSEKQKEGDTDGESTSIDAIPSVLISMIKRLIQNSDWFTSKVSAAGILPTIYKVTQNDDICISLIKELSNDDTPMVRRSCALHLGKFISYINYNNNNNSISEDDKEDKKKPEDKDTEEKEGGDGGEEGGGEAMATDEGEDGTAADKTEEEEGGETGKEETTEDDEEEHVIDELHDGLVNDLIPILTNLCNDEQDSVRLLAVASIGNVGTTFSITKDYDYTCQVLLPLIKNGSIDLSWRVRHNLAKTFSNVAISLGIGCNEIKPSSLNKNNKYINEKSLVMSCFIALLQDIEAEVRAASVGHLARMVHWGGQELFLSHLSPLLPALADDVVMEVRSKCALALMDSAVGGTLNDDIILSSFGPLLENFLQDEFSEVQLHVLTNLPKISRLLEKMNGVVSSILNMAKASNWRVRQSVASLLPHLADARGLDFFLQVLLEPAWLALLLDGVASVRNATVNGVGKLCQVSGSNWFYHNMIPHHQRILVGGSNGNDTNDSTASSNNNKSIACNSYLIRITILKSYIETLKVISDKLNDDDIELFQYIIDILLNIGLNDKVDNVRMITVKGLSEILPIANDTHTTYINSKIKPILETLIQNEQDDDVRYYLDLCI